MNNIIHTAAAALIAAVNAALCAGIAYAFLGRFVGYERKIKKVPTAVFCILIASLCIFPFIISAETDARDIADTVSTLCFIVFPYLIFKVRRKTAFLWIGIAMAASLDYITFIVSYTARLRDIGQMLASSAVYIIIFVLLMIITSRHGSSNLADSFDSFPPIASFMIYAAFLAAYYGVTASFDTGYSKETANSLTMLSSILIVGCIAYLVIKYFSASHKRRETEKQLELELRHYSEMAQKNRDMRVFRHDFKNNLISVRALISDGKYSEAEEYINSLYGRLDATRNSFSTGNYLADAILAEKNAALSHGAKIDFDGIIPCDGIENIDLCTILANALDNAAEGSKHVENAVIGIRALQDGAVFTLTVTNPTDRPVEISGNRIKTTKGDDINHGLGIGSIKNAAKKYGGEVELKYKDGYFTIEVMMILRKGARNEEQ